MSDLNDLIEELNNAFTLDCILEFPPDVWEKDTLQIKGERA
jgi:hypothetical protein